MDAEGVFGCLIAIVVVCILPKNRLDPDGWGICGLFIAASVLTRLIPVIGCCMP